MQIVQEHCVSVVRVACVCVCVRAVRVHIDTLEIAFVAANKQLHANTADDAHEQWVHVCSCANGTKIDLHKTVFSYVVTKAYAKNACYSSFWPTNGKLTIVMFIAFWTVNSNLWKCNNVSYVGDTWTSCFETWLYVLCWVLWRHQAVKQMHRLQYSCISFHDQRTYRDAIHSRLATSRDLRFVRVCVCLRRFHGVSSLSYSISVFDRLPTFTKSPWRELSEPTTTTMHSCKVANWCWQIMIFANFYNTLFHVWLLPRHRQSAGISERQWLAHLKGPVCCSILLGAFLPKKM